MNFGEKFKFKLKKLQKNNSWIFNSISLNLFYACSFIWDINFHNLKYLAKPIKCLKIRVKVKLVRKINEIFLCIFTYIFKLGILFIHLNFEEKYLFGYFKAKYQNVQAKVKLWPIFGLTKQLSVWALSKYFWSIIMNHPVWSCLPPLASRWVCEE